MQSSYLNYITTAVPEHDIHRKFVEYASASLEDQKSRNLLKLLARRSQIEHRYSIFKPNIATDLLDSGSIYTPGKFPDTKTRMGLYRQHALGIACKAIDQLNLSSRDSKNISHLIITSCTGFYAPGIDLEIIEHYGLKPTIERTIIGFMGCYAAINALKLANHLVRSEKSAIVLILNIELCSLHLQIANNLTDLMPFLIFADGCSASIVSSETVGIKIDSFYSTVLTNSKDQITWAIGNSGFEMVLSKLVSRSITLGLPKSIKQITKGRKLQDFPHWAIHPGGRSILDAVQKSIGLSNEALRPSRQVLRQFGNMSSASLMFVLKEIIEQKNTGKFASGYGCAMSFGPGIALESMLFEI